MAELTFRGNPVNTNADVITAGTALPSVEVLTPTLDYVEASSIAPGTAIFNIFPSIDTGVCAKSVETFSNRAKDDDITVINLSVDTPFAQQRFAEEHQIEGGSFGSFIRCRGGLKRMGLLMEDGPLEGFAARAVVVVDADNTVIYSQLVDEIASEPDYDAAILAAKG